MNENKDKADGRLNSDKVLAICFEKTTCYSRYLNKQQQGQKPPSSHHQIRCSALKSNSNFYIMREKHLIEPRPCSRIGNQHRLQGYTYVIQGLPRQVPEPAAILPETFPVANFRQSQERRGQAARSCFIPAKHNPAKRADYATAAKALTLNNNRKKRCLLSPEFTSLPSSGSSLWQLLLALVWKQLPFTFYLSASVIKAANDTA